MKATGIQMPGLLSRSMNEFTPGFVNCVNSLKPGDDYRRLIPASEAWSLHERITFKSRWKCGLETGSLIALINVTPSYQSRNPSNSAAAA